MFSNVTEIIKLCDAFVVLFLKLHDEDMIPVLLTVHQQLTFTAVKLMWSQIIFVAKIMWSPCWLHAEYAYNFAIKKLNNTPKATAGKMLLCVPMQVTRLQQEQKTSNLIKQAKLCQLVCWKSAPCTLQTNWHNFGTFYGKMIICCSR